MADLTTLAGIEAELSTTADYDVAIDVSKAKRRVAALRRKLDFPQSSGRGEQNVFLLQPANHGRHEVPLLRDTGWRFLRRHQLPCRRLSCYGSRQRRHVRFAEVFQLAELRPIRRLQWQPDHAIVPVVVPGNRHEYANRESNRCDTIRRLIWRCGGRQTRTRLGHVAHQLVPGDGHLRLGQPDPDLEPIDPHFPDGFPRFGM